MDKRPIAIILTTCLRPDLFKKTVGSILEHWQPEWKLFIADQGLDKDRALNQDYLSYFERNFDIFYYEIPFNSGLSYARNFLVEKASEQNIEHCLITADSILFSESMKRISYLTKFMYFNEDVAYDIIGLDLKNRKFGWEASINLVEGKYFELNFIDKKEFNLDRITDFPPDNISVHLPNICYHIYNCEIVRNFFIGKTSSLKEVKWDDSLKMAEHEDFFWRFKQAGKKVGYTDFASGEYIGTREGDYNKLRGQNWNNCQKLLRAKYNIQGWVNYINLERAKD